MMRSLLGKRRTKARTLNCNSSRLLTNTDTLTLILGAGTSLFVISSVALSQVPEDQKVKARVDESRLTTSEREQHLLRRLQNRPSFVGTNHLGNGAGDPDVSRMRFGSDDTDEAPTTQKLPNLREQKRPESQDGDEADIDQDQVQDFNEDQLNLAGKRVQDTQQGNRPAAPKNTEAREANELSAEDKPGDIPAQQDSEPNQVFKGQDSLGSPKKLRGPSNIASNPPTSKEPAPVDEDDSQETTDAAYESMEESAETAHLSRGHRQNQLSDQIVNGPQSKESNTPQMKRAEPGSGQIKDRLNPPQLTGTKAKEDEIAAVVSTDEKETAQQIKQLEALKENLKLQRELANAEGKVSELSTELDDTKKSLVAAERQIEELSQRLKHVGDRRYFNNESLLQRPLEQDPSYNSGGRRVTADDQNIKNDNRGASSFESFDSDEPRGRSLANPRLNEIRGPGSDQSFSQPSSERSRVIKSRYLEESTDGDPAPASGLEIPRQIQSETNTPLVSVVGEDVQLRSGPDKKYPSVMRLRKGERIVVEEQSSQWLQIIAPNGARAWIERRETNFDAIARGEPGNSNVPPPGNYRGGRRPPQMSVEDRALELIRRGGNQR